MPSNRWPTQSEFENFGEFLSHISVFGNFCLDLLPVYYGLLFFCGVYVSVYVYFFLWVLFYLFAF